MTEYTETVRIYMYADSGPYGSWEKCPPEWSNTAYNGFGETPIVEIPKELWDNYVTADKSRDAAEEAINRYVRGSND